MECRLCSGGHSCQSLSTLSVGDISIPRGIVGKRYLSSALGSGSGWVDEAGDGVYWCCWDDADGRDGGDLWLVEERFTSIWMDIGKLETELLKARDWSARVQDQINGLETHVRQLEASRRAMREDMDEMTQNMNSLLELNRQMIQDILQLRMSQVHSWDNPIVVDDSSEEDVLDTAPVPVPELVVHTLVPISELIESREDSEEEEETDMEDGVWEISREEFVGSSPEL